MSLITRSRMVYHFQSSNTKLECYLLEPKTKLKLIWIWRFNKPFSMLKWNLTQSLRNIHSSRDGMENLCFKWIAIHHINKFENHLKGGMCFNHTNYHYHHHLSALGALLLHPSSLMDKFLVILKPNMLLLIASF